MLELVAERREGFKSISIYPSSCNKVLGPICMVCFSQVVNTPECDEKLFFCQTQLPFDKARLTEKVVGKSIHGLEHVHTYV